jgi:hypothetical protein
LVHKTIAGMVQHGILTPPGRPGAVTWLPGEPSTPKPSEG